MSWAFIGLALVLHIYFWGLGLSFLILPKRWVRFWPAFCPMAGLGLQSAIVWIGAHTALRGTESYGLASLVLPAGLLVAAIRGIGRNETKKLFAVARNWWGLWLVMSFSFALGIYPLARKSQVLTSLSLGSCDAADYAAGARVLQSFSTRDRTGFLGLTEVVQLSGVDNFPDFWLQLNHFTPSALIALNGAIFQLRPHKLASLIAVVLAVLALPSVFWLARSAFRLRPIASVLVTFFFAISPIVLYGVYHCALGQIIAAPAVALLTWTGLRLFRTRGRLRQFLPWVGLLLVSNWLILGAYNFFIVFSYIPLLAYAGWETLRTREFARAARWLLFLVISLAVAALLFPGRVIKLAARFTLLDKTPFGWHIPTLLPSGWYGAFADVQLNANNSPLAILLGVAGLAAVAYALLRLIAQRRWRVLGLTCASTMPIMTGYWFLVLKMQHGHAESSYDAYKLFAVFLPGIFISLCLWLDLLRPASRSEWLPRMIAAALGISICAGSFAMTPKFTRAFEITPLILDYPLTKIGKIEEMPEVKSVNICFERYWSRLWANYFLLRKPQYFALPTYEGRNVTPLRGDWDLRERFLLMQPAEASDFIEVNRVCYLVNPRSETFLGLRLGDGWYPPEGTPSEPWSWSGGSPQIEVNNPHSFPIATMLGFSATSAGPRTLRLRLEDQLLWDGEISSAIDSFERIPATFPPGRSFLRFESPQPAVSSRGDARLLTVALYGLHLQAEK